MGIQNRKPSKENKMSYDYSYWIDGTPLTPLAAHVFKYGCTVGYEDGWHLMVECWTAADIEAAVKNCKTEDGARKKVWSMISGAATHYKEERANAEIEIEAGGGNIKPTPSDFADDMTERYANGYTNETLN